MTIPNSVTYIDDRAFGDCIGLTSIEIPESVTSIGSSIFQGCAGLTSITIPCSVKWINNEAFSGCSELTDVYCYAVEVPNKGYDDNINIFKDSYIEYATLHVPAESLELYQSTEPWSEFGTIVAITDEESSIMDLAYDDVKSTKDFHTIDGKTVRTLQKGVNIIRYRNGKAKKVFVK